MVNGPRTEPGSSFRSTSARLTVIIVNYGSWPDVVRLVGELEAEPELASGALQVVVVDNASQSPMPDSLATLRPGLRVVSRAENGGFSVGVNEGWRLARTPWLLVLNPDVEIGRGTIRKVLERIDRYELSPLGPPGIVGFGLRNPDGSFQGSVGVFPSLLRTVREQFIPRPRRKYQAGSRVRSGPVDWVTGACMLVNAKMIAELGGMDEDFFLYYEEVAFSREAQARGWRVEHDSSLSVIHRHPLQNRPISPKMRVITRHSKLLYFRKHLPRWQFLGLAGLVVAEAGFQGWVAKLSGRTVEARAWFAVIEVVKRLLWRIDLRGLEVLRFAEQAASEASRIAEQAASEASRIAEQAASEASRIAEQAASEAPLAGSRPRSKGLEGKPEGAQGRRMDRPLGWLPEVGGEDSHQCNDGGVSSLEADVGRGR